MKLVVFLFLLVPALMMVGCGGQDDNADAEANTPAETAHETPAASSVPNPDMWQGAVLESMNSGGYSYIKFVLDGKEVWAAGPEIGGGLVVGDEVEMSPGMMMPNFHSKTLDRDFPEIYFVGKLAKVGQSAGGAANPHGGSGMGTTPPQDASGTNGAPKIDNAKVEPVAKAAAGYTVEEIFGQAQALANQKIIVRARVVKFTANIMNTNWLHIQDGTGEGPTCDLTVTSNDVAAVGDVVLIEGSLSVDKDFGAGYKYNVIIEGASITKE